MRTLCVAVVVVASVALAQGSNVSTVEATGEYAIAPSGGEGPKAKALERAQQEALRSAIEKAAGVYLQADTQTRNNALVLDRITTNASGYIKSFEVLSRSIDGQIAKVTIRAQVSTDTLEKDVKAARAIVGRLFASKLLIVLQEQLMDEKGGVSRSEYLPAVLTAKFKDSGFTIVDEKGTGSPDLGLSVTSGMAQGKLDPKDILKRSDADYIIYGSANVKFVPPDPKAGVVVGGVLEIDPATKKQLIYFVAGDYDLSMFATRTGRQISKQAGRINLSFANKENQLGINYQRSASFAVESSSKPIVAAFFAAVFEELRDQDVNGARLIVRVSGIPAFDEVEDIEKALGVVQGVKAVKAGEFADGKAEFGVQFLGNSAEFGKALKGATMKTRKLVVTAVRNDVVEVNLK